MKIYCKENKKSWEIKMTHYFLRIALNNAYIVYAKVNFFGKFYLSFVSKWKGCSFQNYKKRNSLLKLHYHYYRCWIND